MMLRANKLEYLTVHKGMSSTNTLAFCYWEKALQHYYPMMLRTNKL